MHKWQRYFILSSPRQWASSLLNIALYLLALVGLVQILAVFDNTEAVQPFRSLKVIRPDLMDIRSQTLTSEITDHDTATKHWHALQHSEALLWAINPDISNWLVRLNKEKRIIWTRRPTLFNWPVLASYDWRDNTFYLGPDFWKLSEGDKAAVIAHEYFHYRQNKIWMVGDTLLEAISGKLKEYGSRTEDEAHVYQWFAYRAMSMPAGDTVKSYFSQRKLYRFVLSQPVVEDTIR